MFYSLRYTVPLLTNHNSLMLYCEHDMEYKVLGSRVTITLSKLSDLPLTKAGYGLTFFFLFVSKGLSHVLVSPLLALSRKV